jgi:hypothetical protein
LFPDGKFALAACWRDSHRPRLPAQLDVTPRSVRYWESKDTDPPTNVESTLDSIEQALISHGVIPFLTPTPGVRLG